MSTSLLYHTWGIRGYTYIHTRYERGKTIFRIEQNAATGVCQQSCPVMFTIIYKLFVP
uniref:Uncharacterized protein n=1 Tax=Candidatus Kentrum sp. TUN TaxID=2126343 RepID=A0A451A8Z9_9GAMM|nr:MAG: hypothetical protein BECKTUN1418F_GA0071002_13091 [Candidatus Kentron sp. TUN]VFK71772.1 MAG: hypothetical protein BECKTUN1418E_GA0071001_12952 [Candidatus Kentron sp. TUN]